MIKDNVMKNGKVKTFRDKLDNKHIDVDSHAPITTLDCFDRYEIYSVISQNDKPCTIGDTLEYGIVSDFFIVKENIYVRYTRIIKNESDIKLKKICAKL